ncbi:MAG: MBOAT family protein [Glaciimonas sp.]|nr:MBOAT family protein [Glaciimonas sp.]
MLFNSTLFIFIFMPVVFAGFFLIAKKSHQGAIIWLTVASMFFYAYWSIIALPVLLISIVINYWFGTFLSNSDLKYRKQLLFFIVTVNILALGYYKYVNFFIDNINDVREHWDLDPFGSINIVLPIAMSFFTFTQIAFLIDSYQNKVKERNFIQYALFVSFFPHLLAGPLIHHKPMMAQFSLPENFTIQKEKIAVGLIIFAIGLAKKVLIADTLNNYLLGFYGSLAQGSNPNFLSSWVASLTYTFQIYFDFSGYSDMAVGISLLFGIWLPFNFNSPYKATSIIDFWQRWHISLTRYIGDYLYTPITLKFMRLGQNMPPVFEFIFSLIIPTVSIFLILGFWHGSNWTFVVFGGMHGIYLVVNHSWRKIFPLPSKKNKNSQSYGFVKIGLAWAMTFLAINFANVMFRCDSISTAMIVYKGMLGLNGYSLGYMADLHTWVLELKIVLLTTAAAFMIIFFFPNTISITGLLAKRFSSNKTLVYSSIVTVVCVIYALLQVNFYESPFLYFRF